MAKKKDSLKERKIVFKTVIVGNSTVGKTSIKRSYAGLDYIDNYHMTLGAELSFQKIDKGTLQIWDENLQG